VPAESDGERYGILETLRSFALEQLEGTGEAEATREGHAAYHVEFAETALGRMWEGGWLDRLEADHDNLRAALGWLRDRGDAETGLRLAGAIGLPFWAERGHHTEGRAWLSGFLAVAGPPDSPAAASVRARALLAAGVLAWLQGDYPRAAACHGEALGWARDAGDRRAEVSALNNLAIQANYQGDVARAQPLFEETLALARELEDRTSIATALLNLGLLALDAADYDRSRALHEEALGLARAAGMPHRVALALINLGDDAARQGDYPRAAAMLGEAVSLARETGSLPILAEGLSLLGWVAQAQGNLVRAAAAFTESLTLCRTLGDRLGLANGLLRAAHLALALNQPDRAARMLGAAAALREEIAAPAIPTDQAATDRIAHTATLALGEHGYGVEWGTGRGLPVERAVAEVLALGPDLVPPSPAAPVAAPDSLAPPPAADNPFDLSPRELEVLQLLALRRTDKEIAAALFVSHRTVMSHVANILGKLGVTNRREAAAVAVRLGLA
jgi:non-specific serine/threonine protein kinase